LFIPKLHKQQCIAVLKVTKFIEPASTAEVEAGFYMQGRLRLCKTVIFEGVH